MVTRAPSWCLPALSWLIAAAVLPFVTGCGGEQTTAVFDAASLLERIEQDRRRHDPHAYSEVDLGEYTIAWRENELLLVIRFHLYGVVSDNQLEECQTLLETHGERMRSQVRETVQGSEKGQLEDATLGWLKSDLIQSINQSMQAPVLRDVAFADFTLDRG